MIEEEMIIKNRLGLHARAASMLVELVSHFASDVIIIRDSHEVDAKSIMGVITLAAGEGTEIIVRATGEDEGEAVKGIRELIDRKFDEE